MTTEEVLYMLDEKDLQAIAQIMAQQRRDIMQDVKTLLDTEVQTKFNLLAEGQDGCLARTIWTSLTDGWIR